MNEVTVMVTAVGSTTGMSVIKGLRGQNEFYVRIIGTDIYPKETIAASNFCDQIYRIPTAKESAYLNTILNICKQEKVQLVIPIVDEELYIIAQNRKRFEYENILPIVSDLSVIDVCNDKFKTIQWMQTQDIPCPQTCLLDDLQSCENLTYPQFVKPRDGRSSIGCKRIESPQELEFIRQTSSNLITQPLLEGDEYTTDILTDFNGKVFSVVPRLRAETKAGISTKGRTCHDQRLIKRGATIAERLPIRGPANLQCFVKDNEITFFEINPRFSGGLPLTIKSGVNGPFWLLKLFFGSPTPSQHLPFEDLFMARYWSEVFHR